MAGKPIRNRVFPYQVLGYLLYMPDNDWCMTIDDLTLRLKTGPASRFLRVKISRLWEALYWLEQAQLIKAVVKERKVGTVIIHLRPVKRLENYVHPKD